MKKRLVIALTLLLLFSTYKPQNFSLTSRFNIIEIKIENNFLLKDKDIKKKLVFLYKKNIFFLKTSDIQKTLNEFIFLDGR